MPRTVARIIFLGLVLAGLGTARVHAQSLNAVIQTAADQIPGDMFLCGNGASTCNLTYRIYSAADPAEVNGPANPVDGIPRYGAAVQRYFTDPQTTANFPNAASAGPGHEWYVVWDGTTEPGTPQHAGWYGTQSEVINLAEPHGCVSFNCLPCLVTGPCFRTLNPLNGFNDTVRADGTVLDHVGGISPVPCPSLAENGLDTLTFAWERARNITTNDGAAEGVTGYDLYVLPDPVVAPTDVDLGAAALVASVPATHLSATLDRAALSTTPGLAGATTYVAAIRLQYAGGKESLFFSCNSPLTGVATLDAVQEAGDAPLEVDVVQAFVEIRSGNLLVITLDLATVDLLVNGNDFRLQFDDAGGAKPKEHAQEARIAVRRAGRDGDLVVRFSASFDANLEAFSFIDETTGRVQFVLDAGGLTAALGGSSAAVSGTVKNRSSRDRFDLGIHSF